MCKALMFKVLMCKALMRNVYFKSYAANLRNKLQIMN